MEIKNIIIDTIEEFCEENGYRFRSDYSGRCMYGRKCIGFIVESINEGFYAIAEITERLADEEIQNISQKLGSICYDNMGMNYIIYFPKLNADFEG